MLFNSNYEYDHLLKILLIGDSGVGKSSFLSRYVDGNFSDSYISTIGVDFKIANKNIKNKKIKMQIWDTAGQERFRSITTAYYRGAQGIFVIYDITNMDTFNNVKYWLSEIGKNCSENISILLIGNKLDLSHVRKVTYSDAKKIANLYNIEYIETSAKKDDNIENSFCKIVENILENININIKKNINNKIITPQKNNLNGKKNDKCVC